jgi:hypothetical protein
LRLFPEEPEEAVPAPIGDSRPTLSASGGTTDGIVTAPAIVARHEPEIVDDEPKYLSENELKSLNDLIAAAYSEKYRLADVQSHVCVTELRACLERLSAQGGESSEMPLGFFAAVIRKIWQEIYGR